MQSRDSSTSVGAAGQLQNPSVAGHIPALDGVRGLAIAMVLLFHFLVPTGEAGALEIIVSRVVAYGVLGVDLFFVLSGFLITGILYDSRDDPGYFRNFYMRRALRIFPLYYGVLVVVFLVVPAIPAFDGSEIAGLARHQVWAWLYGVNIYLAIHGDWVLSYVEHFWSLAVEEHFYLVWPLVVWALAAKPRLLMCVSLAVILASLGGRVAASLAGVNPLATTVLTPFQLDALVLGGLLAVYMRQPGGESAGRLVTPLALAGVGLLVLQYVIRHFTGIEATAPIANAAVSVRSGGFHMLLAALLLQVVCAPQASLLSRAFRLRPLVVLGKYSYGLYVYHHFISYYFVTNDVQTSLAGVVGSRELALALMASVGIAVSMGVAWLSFEYYEKPFLKLKRFWSYTRDPVPAEGARPLSGAR